MVLSALLADRLPTDSPCGVFETESKKEVREKGRFGGVAFVFYFGTKRNVTGQKTI